MISLNDNIKNNFKTFAYKAIFSLGQNSKSFKSHMRYEINRLNSFKSKIWPYYYFSKSELANDGFFHIKDDLVECVFCCGILSAFKNGQSIRNKHSIQYPNCPLIENKIISIKLKNFNLKPSNKSNIENMSDLGIFPLTGPIHKNYISEVSRKKTYNLDEWQNLNNLNIDKLVEAGFFSCGTLDYVRCFYCDGFLYDWKTWDNPWKEHYKHFPFCGFLKLNFKISSKQKSLEKSLNKNFDYNVCKICFDNQIGVVFLPCGHQYSCNKCASSISECSICRNVIKGIIKTYFS